MTADSAETGVRASFINKHFFLQISLPQSFCLPSSCNITFTIESQGLVIELRPIHTHDQYLPGNSMLVSDSCNHQKRDFRILILVDRSPIYTMGDNKRLPVYLTCLPPQMFPYLSPLILCSLVRRVPQQFPPTITEGLHDV